MKILMKEGMLLGLLLTMLALPVMADPAITLYYGAQGGSVAPLEEDFTLAVGQTYQFPAHFTGWSDSTPERWEIWAEDKDYNRLSHADPISSGMTSPESMTEWWGGNSTFITIPNNWPEEVWICAECSMDTGGRRSQVKVYIEKGGNVVPEPITLAMTTLGILGVLGFISLKRKRS